MLAPPPALSTAGNDDWANFGKSTPPIAAPSTSATSESVVNAGDDSNWSNFGSAPNAAAASPAAPVVVPQPACGGSAIPAVAPVESVPPQPAVSTGGDRDWSNFGGSAPNPAAASPPAAPVVLPQPACGGSAIPAAVPAAPVAPQSVASTGGDSDWSNFGGAPNSVPTPVPTPIAAPAAPVAPQSVAISTVGDSDWSNFGGAPNSVAATPAVAPVPPQPVVSTGDGGAWANFAGAPTPVSSVVAPQPAFVGNAIPVTAPAGTPVASFAPQSVASTGGDSDWSNFDSAPNPAAATPAASVVPPQAAFGGNPIPAATPAGPVPPQAEVDEDWSNFGGAANPSATPAFTPAASSVAPRSAVTAGGQEDWANFGGAAIPAPSQPPVTATGGASNWSNFSGGAVPAATPTGPQTMGAVHSFTPQVHPAASPMPSSPMIGGNYSVPFYRAGDKNSLYHQLKSAEKAREDQMKAKQMEEMQRKEEMLRKQEEDQKKGMFKDLVNF